MMSRDAAEAFLKRWHFWASHSRQSPVIEAARTIRRHWAGILRWFDSRIANDGLIKGINSLVQSARRGAIAQSETSRPSSIARPKSSTSSRPRRFVAIHPKQRGTELVEPDGGLRQGLADAFDG